MRWIGNFLTGGYLRFLEAEVERLRSENRALTNSLFAQVGAAPLVDPEKAVQKPPPKPAKPRFHTWHQIARSREAKKWQELASLPAALRPPDGRVLTRPPDSEQSNAAGPLSAREEKTNA